MNDRNCDEVLHNPAWDALRLTVESLLDNGKKPNYRQLVNQILPANKMARCNTLLRLHFPHIQLNFFAVILGDVSDEHSGGFNQEISALDKHCQGKWKLTITGSLKEKFRICIQENQAEKILTL